MGRRPPHRRLRAASWPAALLLVAGCTAPVGPTATPIAPGTLADRLNAALAADSEDAFADGFSAQHDPSADGRRWFRILRHATVASIAQPDDHTLSVTSGERGDAMPATVTLTVQRDATGRIRSVTAAHPPIWVLGPTDVTDAVHGTLFSAGLDEASRRQWADRIDHAVDAVARFHPPGADAWPGGLVVEIPADASAFAARTGKDGVNASAVSTCDSGTPRIVVNPAVLGQPAEWLDSTMVHEGVHVATRSPCRPSGQLAWAVEGLAESAAAASDPVAASRNRGLVLAYLRDHPVPRALPTDLDDLTGYALAQVAVDQLRARAGEASRDLLDRAGGDGGAVTANELRRVTGWYTAELERLRTSG